MSGLCDLHSQNEKTRISEKTCVVSITLCLYFFIIYTNKSEPKIIIFIINHNDKPFLFVNLSSGTFISLYGYCIELILVNLHHLHFRRILPQSENDLLPFHTHDAFDERNHYKTKLKL